LTIRINDQKNNFHLLDDDGKEFNKHQIKSLDMVGNMVKENGGKWFKNLEEISDFVNFNKI
jgi:hypothetical protein